MVVCEQRPPKVMVGTAVGLALCTSCMTQDSSHMTSSRTPPAHLDVFHSKSQDGDSEVGNEQKDLDNVTFKSLNDGLEKI